MGTGWRRALCAKSIPRLRDRQGIESEQHNNQIHQSEACQISSPTPVRTCAKLGIFSSPKFRSEALSADNTPGLHCKTAEKESKSPRVKLSSTPSSPRSPFSILKNTLRLSRSGCGVCLQSVKSGQGTAIFTAECAHSFHFPCISQHVRKQGSLICPVCNRAWKDVPLLNFHKETHPLPVQDVVDKTVTSSVTRSPIFVGDTRLQFSIPAIKTSQVDKSRPYNDDEPLVYPAGAGARFNPIPEGEDEDNEDHVEQFQGFFVNRTPSSTPTKKLSASALVDRRRTQRNVEVKLLPEAAIVTAGRSHETFAVALRVKAPPPPPIFSGDGVSTPPLQTPSLRAPIDLVTVLDLSGSMTRSNLHMLKRAMRLVISSLRSSDRFSIVSFSSSPQRLLPLRRMSHQGQRLARRILDHLNIGEGNSVNEALKMASKVLEDRREKNPIARIILLSDGLDQSSQTNGVSQRKSTGHIEIPVHSLGSYNDHESVTDAFAKRVGGLLSVVVQDVRLQLAFSSGSAPGEITAVYSCNGRPSFLNHESIKLGELYAEEERELLVEIRVPTSEIGSHHVMTVRCSYRDPATGEVMYGRERALLVPRRRAARSSDPRIERLRNIFLTMRAVAEARRLAEVGEFGTAQQLLGTARALVAQSSSGSAEEYVRWLETELAALQWRSQGKEAAVDPKQRKRIGEQHVALVDENGEPLTPTSAWRAADRLAKLAVTKKLLNRSRDLHGFENARF